MASGLFNLKQVNQAISQGAWSGYIAPRWVEYLVVAGGGAGNYTGGGGAGGLLTGIVTVTTGASYTVTVGAGGTGVLGSAGQGAAGVSSVFGSISAIGGGLGVHNYTNAGSTNNGGSGGGGAGVNPTSVANSPNAGGTGLFGQGNAGGSGINNAGSYYGGGGGGAGTVGLNAVNSSRAGNGGAGIASAITGTTVVYAGGGGGGTALATAPASSGGAGGGGAGGFESSGGGSGTANTGGGGGSGSYLSTFSVSGSGGSGIVVVRYPGNVVFFTGGTVNYNNGYIIHIFTSNGTLAPTAPAPYNTSYQISRSLRFNSPDSVYLSRTPASTTNRRTWTWSGWIKRSSLVKTDELVLFACRPSAYTIFSIRHSSTANPDTILLEDNNGTNLRTTQVFRDVSAWYHIVLAVDTTQATDTNRVKLYVNGSQVTAFSATTYPTQNVDLQINTTNSHGVGGYSYSALESYDGYMTEVNFVDGTQLTPSSFGATSTTTGVWSPIQYTGTYGTNGFYLNFSDNSNTTAATLGKDYSGNGNNWTPNNFSVTAGAGNDSMVDSPTQYGFDTGVGGTVRGNYCTLNPLSVLVGTTSNGNLDGDTGTTNGGVVYATMNIPNSGKWYWEYTQTNTGLSFSGIEPVVSSTGASVPITLRYIGDGTKQVDATTSSYGASYGNGDIIGTAVDVDTGTVTFYKNGTSQGAITYATASLNITPSWRDGSGGASLSYSANFGQRPFAYTAPSGFLALNTQNLPTPTIGATSNSLAGQFFNTVLYTGTGASLGVTGVGFQPDWVWVKGRSGATDHGLYDAVRGVQKQLESNTTSAETTETTGITAFGSDGFTTGALAQLNTSSATYVAWNWRAGNNAGASNSAGSITSTVSVNTTSGFSIVTYTGTGANATVGHGLGVAPSMVIYKNRTSNSTWIVYHTSISPTNLLVLNDGTAQQNLPAYFNSLAATSSVLNIGSNSDMNASGANQLAYCFAPVAGFSAFGSYTGNGSTDGPFVFTGMRPAFVIIRRTAAENWYLYDVARGTYNVIGPYLQPNLSSAEATGTIVDFLSNGFKIRESGAGTNTSASTYIYMAFASNPFKYSLAR